MNKKWVIALFCMGTLAVAIAWWWQSSYMPHSLPDLSQGDKEMIAQEHILKQYLQDSTLISYFTDRTQLRYIEDVQAVIQSLEQLEAESFAVFLLNGKQVLFASPQINLRPDEVMELSTQERAFKPIQGWLYQKYPLGNGVVAIGFFPKEKKGAQVFGMLFLFILGIILLWIGFHQWINDAFQANNLLVVGILLLSAASVLLFLSSFIGKGTTLVLFEPIYPFAWLGPNGIGLLFKSASFLWAMGWMYKILQEVTTNYRVDFPKRWAVVYYWASILMLGGVAWMLKHILIDSSIFFNFENSLQISWLGLAVALSILFLLVGAFLFVYTLFLPIRQWTIGLNDRLLLMVISLLLALPLILALSLGFPIWIWLLTGLVFLILFDLFVENEDFNLTWLLVWAITLSAFSASLSYKYILDKDASLMQDYGQQLLGLDRLLEGIDYNEIDLKSTQSRKDWLANQPYLQQHYEWGQRPDSSYVLSRLAYAKRALIEQFSRRGNLPYLQMDHIDRYEYLVLDNGQAIDKQRDVVGLENLSLEMIEAQARQLIIQNNRLTSVQSTDDGRLAILQRTLGSYFKPLSLFAVFFVLLLSTLLGMVGLQAIIPVLPPFFYALFQTRNSLQNRIQLSIIGIILASSIVIAIVTIFYFKSIATERKDRLILNQMENIKLSLEEQWMAADSVAVNFDSDMNFTESPFSLYNRQGRLLYTNLPQPIVQSYMPPSILETLKIQLLPYALSAEAQRQTIFTTINGPSGSIESYLSIPFSYSDTASQLEINNFVGSIFSLYVFFMFIAGGVAIWVANSITEPINAIGRGLRQLKLGSNTPLVWKNEDEIGLLIQEYNHA
ncbi:MAG: hypothetical protein AAF242_06075, partial [Bacteroidota bacterium]